MIYVILRHTALEKWMLLQNGSDMLRQMDANGWSSKSSVSVNSEKKTRDSAGMNASLDHTNAISENI